MLDDKLNWLKSEVVKFAMHVEHMIEKSITALAENNKEMLLDVIERDEAEANRLELEFDEACIGMIAQFEPKAKQLRLIMMVNKTSADLERMADHGVNIAQSALRLLDLPPVKPFIDLPRMAQLTIKMLKDSIMAFINEDCNLAHDICQRDSIIDAVRDQNIRVLITYMISKPSTIETSLELLTISRNLERIADLTTNICEEIIFIVDGTNIKHQQSSD